MKLIDSWLIGGNKTMSIIRQGYEGFRVVFSEGNAVYEDLFFKQYIPARNYAKDIMAGYRDVVYKGA